MAVQANIALKQVSIVGNRTFLPSSEIINRAEQFSTGLSSHLDLSKEESSQLQTELTAAAIDQVNARVQNAMRMKTEIPQEEGVYVRKTDRTITGALVHGQVNIPIYERDEKEFADATERQEWQPRIELIEKAFVSPLIFSISLIPTDPNTQQTLYSKKSLGQADPLPSDQELIAFFGFLPPGGRGPSQASEFKTAEKISIAKAGDIAPPQRLTGFFLPYPTFSSELAAAEYNPAHLPASVGRVYAFSETEVERSVADMENGDLQARIKSIVSSFTDDVHARGLGMVILQPPRVKVLFYTKAQ